MEEIETGLIKIGVSMSASRARKRVPEITRARRRAAGKPSTIRLLLWVAWPHTDEKAIHRYLWASWAGGEWFRDSKRLREVMRYLHDDHYLAWREAFRAAESTLPPAWNRLDRDCVLEQHKAKTEV